VNLNHQQDGWISYRLLTDFQIIYNTCQSIYLLEKTVEGNKKRCDILVARCRSLESPLAKLQVQNLSNDSVRAGLENLCGCVLDCKKFIEKFGHGGWKRFLLNRACATTIDAEFLELNRRLTNATSDLNFNFNTIVSEELDRANAEDGKQVVKILCAIYSHLNGKNSDADKAMATLVNDQCPELWNKVAYMEQIIAVKDDMAVPRTPFCS